MKLRCSEMYSIKRLLLNKIGQKNDLTASGDVKFKITFVLGSLGF